MGALWLGLHGHRDSARAWSLHKNGCGLEVGRSRGNALKEFVCSQLLSQLCFLQP